MEKLLVGATHSWRKNEPSTSFSTQNFVAIVDMLRNSLRTLPWVSKFLTQFEKDYQDLKANEAPPKKSECIIVLTVELLDIIGISALTHLNQLQLLKRIKTRLNVIFGLLIQCCVM